MFDIRRKTSDIHTAQFRYFTQVEGLGHIAKYHLYVEYICKPLSEGTEAPMGFSTKITLSTPQLQNGYLYFKGSPKDLPPLNDELTHRFDNHHNLFVYTLGGFGTLPGSDTTPKMYFREVFDQRGYTAPQHWGQIHYLAKALFEPMEIQLLQKLQEVNQGLVNIQGLGGWRSLYDLSNEYPLLGGYKDTFI